MKLNDVLTTARDTVTVRRVYAEPYEANGVTVIAGAAVSGGGGGGGGRDHAKDQEGEGGGFGMNAKPTGAFVIRKNKVRWRPAVDVNRVAALAAAVAIAYLLTRARIRRS